MSIAEIREPNVSDVSDSPVEHEIYRSVSKAAIASVALSFLGLLAFSSSLLLVIPVLGFCLGLVGWLNIRRYPDELTGVGLAKIGMIAGAILTIGAIGFQTYTYATEVPEGYERLLFYDLKPKSNSQLFSEKAEELDGKQIFVKGYVRPGLAQTNLDKFVLTGDFGDCCFGGNPKMTDVVAVRILSDQRVDYSYSLRRILGTFRLHRNPEIINEKGVPQVVYEIEASDIQ